MRHSLGAAQHVRILWTVGLLRALPIAGNRRSELDGVEVNLDVLIDIFWGFSGNALLVSLSQSEHVLEDIASASDCNLLLDSESDVVHCQVALLVRNNRICLYCLVRLISIPFKTALDL